MSEYAVGDATMYIITLYQGSLQYIAAKFRLVADGGFAADGQLGGGFVNCRIARLQSNQSINHAHIGGNDWTAGVPSGLSLNNFRSTLDLQLRRWLEVNGADVIIAWSADSSWHPLA